MLEWEECYLHVCPPTSLPLAEQRILTSPETYIFQDVKACRVPLERWGVRLLRGCPRSLARDVSLCLGAVRGLRDGGWCPAHVLCRPALMNFFGSPWHGPIWFLYQRELSCGSCP